MPADVETMRPRERQLTCNLVVLRWAMLGKLSSDRSCINQMVLKEVDIVCHLWFLYLLLTNLVRMFEFSFSATSRFLDHSRNERFRDIAKILSNVFQGRNI